MKWEMGVEEIEAVLERIWDLHDKLSDAIHAITRSHFLNSIKTIKRGDEIYEEKKKAQQQQQPREGSEEARNGFVFMKDIRFVDDAATAAVTEAKSLNAIRTALENLEDQLEFFHTVQSQQRAERDAAIARLEQSRIVLAMRLANHHGKSYRVIEEAMAFIGDVQNAGPFGSTENRFESPRSQSGKGLKDHEKKRGSTLMHVLLSSFTFVKRTLKLEQLGGVLGNAALVAVSVLALLQLHQATYNKSNFVLEGPQMQDDMFYGKRNGKKTSHEESSSSGGHIRHLDVLEARG